MTEEGEHFVVDVLLDGGKPPSSSDRNHTMNVATFYDVNGDGEVDYQVWANLSSKGWGASYFDDGPNSGPNRFGAESGVGVSLTEDSLRLTFPKQHLGLAGAFRWSVASEWGSYSTIGSAAAARDDAPDDDAALDFPG